MAFVTRERELELTCVEASSPAFIEAGFCRDHGGCGLAIRGDGEGHVGERDREVSDAAGGPSRGADYRLTSGDALKRWPGVHGDIRRERVAQGRGTRQPPDVALLCAAAHAIGDALEHGDDLCFVTGEEPLPAKPQTGSRSDGKSEVSAQKILGPIRRVRVAVPNSCSAIAMPRLSPTTK